MRFMTLPGGSSTMNLEVWKRRYGGYVLFAPAGEGTR